MHIEKLTDFHDFLSLREQWNSLLTRGKAISISMTHEWLCCWWEAFGNDGNMCVLLLKEGDNLLGAAPLSLSRHRFRGLPANILTLMENGHTPDAFMLFDGAAPDMGVCILEFLRENRNEWDVLKLNRLPELWVKSTRFEEWLRGAGFLGIRISSFSSPYIDVTGDWDTYYAGRSKKFRKVMRNKLNRVERDGSITIERISEAQTIKNLLDEVFAVSARSWKATHGRSIPDDPHVETFYRRLTDIMGEKESIDLWLMRRGDEAIAFEYHLRHSGITYPIRADFVDAYSHLSPGSVLEYHIINSLFDNNEVHGYNSCGDTYEYLMKWATEVHERVGFFVFSPKAYSKNLFLVESKMVPFAKKVRDMIRTRTVEVSK